MQKIDQRDESVKRRYRLLKHAGRLRPNSRMAQCSWRISPAAAYAVGRYVPGAKSSYIANLMHCDKPLCPICGFKRASNVRRELSIAMAQAEKMGIFPVLITGTIRHRRSDSLQALKEALAKAWDKTFSGRWYDDLCAEFGIVGKTKTWETTYGQNGHHPHIHSLMFMALELAGKHLIEFEERLRTRYIEQLRKLGFDASWEHGLDVRTAESDIAAYIAKFGREPKSLTWGADSEVAMSAVKTGRLEGMTPLELLAAADGQPEALARLGELRGINNDPAEVQRFAGILWGEVYDAFERTAMIHWGKNLRDRLELDEALAEYAAANPVERDDIDMVLIEKGDEWRKVLALPDGRAELRAVIRTGDAFKVLAWLGEHGIKGIVPDEALAYSAALLDEAQDRTEQTMQADDSAPDTIWDRDNAGSYADPLQPALCEQLILDNW